MNLLKEIKDVQSMEWENGLNKELLLNKFIWIHDGTILEYNLWKLNHPTSTENCVAIQNNILESVSCTTQLPGICEGIIGDGKWFKIYQRFVFGKNCESNSQI